MPIECSYTFYPGDATVLLLFFFNCRQPLPYCPAPELSLNLFIMHPQLISEPQGCCVFIFARNIKVNL